MKAVCTPDIYKQIVLILSCLSISAEYRPQGRIGLYYQAQAPYRSLRTSYGVNTRQICSSRSHKYNV